MTVRKIAAAGALLVALAAGCRGAWAVWPQVWFKGSQAHFEPGRFDRVSLSDAGEVALAPAPELVFEPAGESFVWSLAESRAGELYAGTGPHGRVYRRSKGKWGLALETGDVAVTALAAAPDGSVYAGTIPSGRIFRIASGGFQAGPPIETGERYVWALRSLPDGALVAGTGARARVLRFDEPGAVPPEKPKVLLESQEDHILCLLRWPDGALLAGSGGHGLLYRIEPDGKTRVVFDAPQEEIRALAIDGDTLYAAAQTGPHAFPGSRPAPPAPPALSLTVGPAVPAVKTASRGPKGNSTGALPLSEPPAPPKKDAASPPPAPPRATAHFGRTGPNASQAVWAIAPAGVASQVFACDQEVLLSVAARPEGGIAVGTGNSGQCFLVGRDGRLTRWVNLEEGQAMAFLRRSNGDLLVGTGNPGRVRSLSEAAATTGTLTTEALDAGLPSRWGRVSWRTRGQGEIRIATRSGNSERPDAAWSDWSAALSAPEGSSISSPPGRFLQVRLSLAGRAGKDSPVLESLRLNYLPANAAPSIDSLEVTSPVAEVYAEHREPSIKERDRQFEAAKKRPPLGMRRIKWDASDPNRDRLSALLFLREAKEKSWRPLLDEPTAASEYDWDVRNTPDGVYRVKVVVSDGWSNPPGTALSASRESEAFVVDTSPPAISTPQLAVASGVATVTATVEDSTSNILSLEYLLDSGDWTPTAPKDGFADSRREELAMELRGLSPGEHALALRARDEAGNVANVRLVIDAR